MVLRMNNELAKRSGKAAAFLVGALASAASVQAQCDGFNYVEGVTAIARHDISAEITDIQFKTGTRPSFTVFYTVDADDLGPFRAQARLGITVENARVAPGRRVTASGCFPIGPRRFNNPGPYKATFYLGGKDWQGVLPQANYKATIDVALNQGGRLYEDLNLADNHSEMSKRYRTRLVTQARTVDGNRDDREVTYAVDVVNTGNRPSGPLTVRWWTRGIKAMNEHFDVPRREVIDSVPAGEEVRLENTFVRQRNGVRVRRRFGHRAKVVVRDSNNLFRLRSVSRIRNAPAVVDPDPDPNPVDPDPVTQGIDYAVQDVHASVLSLGDGNFILSSSVVNQGNENATDVTRVIWKNLSVDGPFSFRPLGNSIPPLACHAGHEMLAVLDLSGADDPSLRAKQIAGTLEVSAHNGDVDGDNNIKQFGLDLAAPPVEEPTPPQVVGSEIESEALDPEYAGWDGDVEVAVRLQNNGGEATRIRWSVDFPGLELNPDSIGTYEIENVGAGETLDKQWISFIMKEENFAEPGEPDKVYRGVISGTTQYRNGSGQIVDGEAFEFETKIQVGAYPRPDLDLSVYVQDAAGNSFVPAAQLFSQTPATVNFNLQVDNNGAIRIHPDDVVRASWEIPGYTSEPMFAEVPGLDRGDSFSVLDNSTVNIDCGYWSGDRERLLAMVTTAPSETRTGNNSFQMGLRWDNDADPSSPPCP